MKCSSFLFISLFLFSCSGDETRPGTRLSADVNETITIVMKSNVTTGYKWFLVRKPAIADSVSSTYSSDFGAGCSNGAGGMETWQFKGTKKGIDTIGFVYARELNQENEYQATERLYVVEVN